MLIKNWNAAVWVTPTDMISTRAPISTVQLLGFSKGLKKWKKIKLSRVTNLYGTTEAMSLLAQWQ